MTKKQHGTLRPEHKSPYDVEGRGNHILQGFVDKVDEASRLAIAQTALDRGRVVEQTGGEAPGLYVADGVGGWFYLGGWSSGSLHLKKICTTGDVTLYVDDVNGNDTNTGTSTAPLKTLTAAINKLPVVIDHVVRIFLANHSGDGYALPNITAKLYRQNVYIHGGWLLSSGSDWVSDPTHSGIDEIATFAAEAGSGTALIKTTGITKDEYVPYFIEVLSGAALGDRRCIRNNTTTDIIPLAEFSSAIAETDQIRIFAPSVRIAINKLFCAPLISTPGDLSLSISDNNVNGKGIVLVNVVLYNSVSSTVTVTVDGTLMLYGVKSYTGQNITFYGQGLVSAGFDSYVAGQAGLAPYNDLKLRSQKSWAGWGLVSRMITIWLRDNGFHGFITAIDLTDLIWGRINIRERAVATLITVRSGKLQLLNVQSYCSLHKYDSIFSWFENTATFAEPIIEIRSYQGAVRVHHAYVYAAGDGVLVADDSFADLSGLTGTAVGYGIRARDSGIIQYIGDNSLVGALGDITVDDGVTTHSNDELIVNTHFTNLEQLSMIYRRS